VITGHSSGTQEEVFVTPAVDFQLSRITIDRQEGIALPARKTDIYFVYKGAVDAAADEQKEHFVAGEVFLAVPGTVVHFGSEEGAVVFRATEPVAS
jgi:hypothetical protein